MPDEDRASPLEETHVVRYLPFAADHSGRCDTRQVAGRNQKGRGNFMAQRLTTNLPLSNSATSRDTRPTFRTITAFLAAAGAGLAISTVIGTPIAVAQVCGPNQVMINGQCTDLQNANNPPVLPPGTPGKIQCTQHSCVYYPTSGAT